MCRLLQAKLKMLMAWPNNGYCWPGEHYRRSRCMIPDEVSCCVHHSCVQMVLAACEA
jgi:hypothetical protein